MPFLYINIKINQFLFKKLQFKKFIIQIWILLLSFQPTQDEDNRIFWLIGAV